MKNSDVALIQRVLAGDDDAFSVLVRKYQKQVHALAWRKIGDFHIAEEITQDTFLQAYKRLTTLKEPQRFVGWLYVITVNECNTWLRKKRLDTQSLEHLNPTDKEQLEKEAYSEFVVEENERISGQTQRDVVKKLLAKLGESERTVMTLHYFGEMSCSEIGTFMGVSTNTIKSRLRRAQQRLKKEEVMIREAIDNFQISPNLTETIMQEISRIKPTTPSSSKPFIPWAVAASTLAVVLLMLGFGNHQYLTRFQKPYSFDSSAEMEVEIIDTPIVANLESKQDLQNQVGSANVKDKNNNFEQPNNTPGVNAEIQDDEIAEDWTKWELPKAAKARLGKGGIRAMQFSPDGTLLAIGSTIGVWLYDAKTGKELSLFPGACQSLAFSPDGQFLANGGSGGVGGSGKYHGEEVQLWEVSTGKRMTLAKSPPSASAVRFSEDSKTLIILGDWENRDTIGNLNIETGEVNLKKFRELPKDSYSESYALTHDKLAIGQASGKIQLWDPISGKKPPFFRGHSGKFEQENIQKEMSFEIGTREHIETLAISPDGSQLAIGSIDGRSTTVLLWDTTGNNEPIILRKHTNDSIHSVSASILAFSPNGKILASGDTDNKVRNTLRLWDTSTGKLLAKLTGHIRGITSLTFSPDSSTLATANADGTVLFWNTETKNPLPIHISNHSYTQRGMAILKDSDLLASVAFNSKITFWDLKTQRKANLQTKGRYDFLQSLAFSPDGSKLAIADEQLVQLTDVRTGRELARLTVRRHTIISAMAISPDGKTVALGSSREIHLWNTDTGKIFNIPLTDTSMSMFMFSTIIFSRDGKKLVSGDSQGKVQIWDTKTGDALTTFLTADEAVDPMDNEVRFVFPENLISALAYSADDDLLAVGSYEKIYLFGSQKKTHFKEVPNVNCNALVFSPDDTLLVVGQVTGGIKLFDIATGDELATLDGHTAPIVKLLFSSDGKTLVSTGYDGTILLWDWDEALRNANR